MDTDTFHAQVDDILTYMSLAKTGKRLIDEIDAAYFDKADPIISGFREAAGEKALTKTELEAYGFEGGKVNIGAFGEMFDCKPTDLAAAVDYSAVMQASGGFKFSLEKLRQISVKEARGRVAGQCKFNFKLSSAMVDPEGVIRKAQHIHLGYQNDKWVGPLGMDRNHSTNRWLMSQWIGQAKILLNAQLCSQERWSVYLGWEGHPCIRFLTDSVGARAVFRLRDIPEGKSRRAALRHWVTEHWRSSGESRVEVRRHMRGATQFVWNGLRCDIEPSAADRIDNKEVVKIISPSEFEASLKEMVK